MKILMPYLFAWTADKQPGYMRSRVYEAYNNGTWDSKQVAQTMNLLTEEHEYTHSTFSFLGATPPKTKEGLEKINIFYSSNFKVANMLHMGGTEFIEMTCETLQQTQSGTITGKDADFSGGITLYNRNDRTEEDPLPAPKMTDDLRASYTQVEDSLRDRLKAMVGGSNIFDTSSANNLANSLQKYFHDSFTYELGVNVSSTDDPIMRFLEIGKGHCELFASTTVMTMRSYGFPARYVTGFYCSEPHPSGSYYLGRSRDLHAWVEYYDDQSQSWKLLEPTPPGGLPNSTSQFNAFTAAWDSLTRRWQDLMSNIVRGYFAETIILFLKSILDLIIWCFNSPLKFIVSSSILAWFFYKRRPKKVPTNFSKDFTLLKKEIDKVIFKIGKIKDLKLTPSMTITEIAAIIEQREHPNSKKVAQCLRDYEVLRYNESKRSPESVSSMKNEIAATLKAGIG